MQILFDVSVVCAFVPIFHIALLFFSLYFTDEFSARACTSLH